MDKSELKLVTQAVFILRAWRCQPPFIASILSISEPQLKLLDENTGAFSANQESFIRSAIICDIHKILELNFSTINCIANFVSLRTENDYLHGLTPLSAIESGSLECLVALSNYVSTFNDHQHLSSC